ncbi:MAG: glycosyltransferase [Verrucomicrobiae bacterium]|nr:glycosyltransferase [Verrucomicrobiae bacterium]NNJ86792.1 glycosyltransferase family 2 protein [Akkermansiaceae bacterium]
MSIKPRISCIISTYGDADLVHKKIEEICRQTIFDEVEFLFVETGSPDRERDIIAPYTEQYSNIHLITDDERRTLYQAWNMGWEAATASLLCYSNMDDALHPRCLEIVVETMHAEPELDLCSVMVAYQNKDSPGDQNSFVTERLRKLKISRRPGPFTAWRDCLRDKIGMFDGRYRVVGDLDFWSRAAHEGIRAKLIRKVLYLYTTAPSQLSKSHNKKEELADAAGKSGGLRWHPKVANAMLFHRKVFRLFPSIYLIDGNTQ